MKKFSFRHKQEANRNLPEKKGPEPAIQRKTICGQLRTLKKHVTSMSCTPESAIQSFDMGQQIHCVPYFDSCQLTIT